MNIFINLSNFYFCRRLQKILRFGKYRGNLAKILALFSALLFFLLLFSLSFVYTPLRLFKNSLKKAFRRCLRRRFVTRRRTLNHPLRRHSIILGPNTQPNPPGVRIENRDELRNANINGDEEPPENQQEFAVLQEIVL